ncbi:MAG: hypothetical protein PHU85_01405 [Phycisphaerae bacterium]|nr:hypothetical protein [Phycisphaerae bacterium]
MGRPSNPPFALIGAVVLLVIAVAAAVGLYMNQGKLEKQVADIKADRDKMQVDLTLVKSANKAIMEKWATEPMAADQASAEKVRAKIEAVLIETTRDPSQPADKAETYKGYNVLDVIRQLRTQRDQYFGEITAARTEATTNLSTIKKLNDEKANLTTEMQKAQGAEAQARADLTKKHTDELARKDGEITGLNKEKADVKKELDELKMKVIADRGTWDQDKSRLENRIKEYEAQIRKMSSAGTVANDARGLVAKQPDGAIAQVFPDQNTVYLRLARPQQAKLGMRYVIFGKDKPVPDNGEGKGVVEISGLEGGSIQAKIIKSTAGDPLVPGDMALNLVVGPRKYNFVVFGNFDLNNDGVTESNGKFQLESLITRWGGVIQQDIDISTNFLILGDQPTVPPKPAEGADPNLRDIWEKANDKNKKWAELYDKAYKQTIPIMNTVTVLHFLGYFNDDTGPGWEKRVRPGEDYFPGS